MVGKDTWYDFKFPKFTKAWFLTQDMIYPGECSKSSWQECILWKLKSYQTSFQPQHYKIRKQLQEKKNCEKQPRWGKTICYRTTNGSLKKPKEIKKIPGDKWKQKHDDQKIYGM